MTKTNFLIVLLLAITIAIISFSGGKKVQAADHGISNPVVSNGVTTWDTVYFGNYYQSNDATKEPIRWRVLSVNNNDAFLLSDKNLDSKRYNEVDTDLTWETCSLRTWLNSSFLNTAFNSVEQSAIKFTTVTNNANPTWGTEGGKNTTDKVFLMSIDEVRNSVYGFNPIYDAKSETRASKTTWYAKNQGAVNSYDADWTAENSHWWLRSPGIIPCTAVFVSPGGAGYGTGTSPGTNVIDIGFAIRPALHLDLSSSSWNYGGKVSANIGEPNGSTEDNKKETPITSKDVPKVKIKAKNVKKKSVKLSWKKAKNADGYKVQCALNKKFTKKAKIAYVKASKTSKTIKKLKKKKTYYFRVAVYRNYKGKKVFGKWSNIKKIKIKK